MYGYIYLTVNKVNNKRYVGQSTYKKNHIAYKGSGKILQKAMIKYGLDNFDKLTLCECKDKYELDYMEVYYIDKYNAMYDTQYYNISCGGQGGNLGPVVNKRISDSVTGVKNGMYGKTHTTQAAERIRKSRLGKTTVFSDESKQNISNSLKRYFNDNTGAKTNLSNKIKQYHINTDISILLQTNKKRINSLNTFWENNEDAKKAVSDRVSGINNPMYGKSPKVKGYKWFSHPIHGSKLLHPLDPSLNAEWKLGRNKC